MRYKLLALCGSLVTLAACTSYAILKLSLQSPEALPLTQCQSDELYPDLTDCSKFYICSPDGPELFQCPLGFHFNPTKLVCDWTINAGCILNDDASSTIISFETIYADEIATGSTEVSVVELDNGHIISSNLDTKSPSFQPSSKITGDIDKIFLNITSKVEETTHSNNTNTNTAKFSQFPTVNPEVTLTIINEPNANETNSHPILASVNNFIVNDQKVLTEISSEVDFNSESTTINPNYSQYPVLTNKLDITSDFTIKIGRNDSTKHIYNIYTKVTKDYTQENEVSSTNAINSVGSNLSQNNEIVKIDAISKSANTNHSNNDRNPTITYGNLIQNTDKAHFSSDISVFEQHNHDAYINISSKNDDNIKLEDKDIPVPAGIKVVAQENASQGNKDTPYLSYEGNMISTEGNFKSDMEAETNSNQRLTEEISTVPASETNNNANWYARYSELYESTISSLVEEDSEITLTESVNNTHSEIHLISTVGKFTDSTSSQSVNSFDENNDTYFSNGKSAATTTYSDNKVSNISSRYDGDQKITTVGPYNINDVETYQVADQAKFATDNVIDNTTTKEANSVSLPLTYSDNEGEERITTTTTNIHVNISASIYDEDATSEYLNNNNNNISIHIENNNDTEHYVSSKSIDEKTIPYISNREDMYSEIEKYSSYGYTPLVSHSEFVDKSNLNYKDDEDNNEIANEHFLSSTDFADTSTGNTLNINNFYHNVDDRLSSSSILINKQGEFNNELVNHQNNTSRVDIDDMGYTTNKHLMNVYNATISFAQTIQSNTWTTNIDNNAKYINHKNIDNNTSLENEYGKEMASAVLNRKTDQDITTKIANVNNNKNDNSSSTYEKNNQNSDKVIFSYAHVTQTVQSMQQIVSNVSVVNILVSIKNNSKLEKNNLPSTIIDQGGKIEDNLNDRQYSENLEALTEYLDGNATTENNFNHVENMSTIKPNEMNRFSTDIESETFFSSAVQENFSISTELVNSPSDVSYDNLNYSEIIVNNYMGNNKSNTESVKEKYITDTSFDTTRNISLIDTAFNTANNILQNREETSLKDDIITNDLRLADNLIFSTTTSPLQEDNATYEESVRTTQYIDNIELYTEESSKHIESQLISSESYSNKGTGVNDYQPYSEKDEIELSTESMVITDNRQCVPTFEYNSNLPHANEESNIENNIFLNNNVTASVIADNKKGIKAKGFTHDNNSKYLENENGIVLSTANFSKTREREFYKNTEGTNSTTSMLVISDPIFKIDSNDSNIENIKSSIKVSNSVIANEEKFTTAQLSINLDAHDKYSKDLTRVVISSSESVSEDLVNYMPTDYSREKNQYSEIKGNGNIIYNYINKNNSPIESTREHITDTSSDTTESNAIYNVDYNTIESLYTANTDTSSENKTLLTNITHKVYLTTSSQLPQEVEDHSIYIDVNDSSFEKSKLLVDTGAEKIQLANITNENLNNGEFSKDSVSLIPAINDLNSTNNQTTDTSSDSYSDNINSDNMNKYVSFNTKINIDNQINKSVSQVNVVNIDEVFNYDTDNYLNNELYHQKENSAKDIITMHSSRNDSIISENTQKVIPDGSKSTNDLQKDETILVATSSNENKTKNDLTTDLAQGLKDEIIFLSTSNTTIMNKATHIVNLSISTEQITNVTVNNNVNLLSQRRPDTVVTPLTNIKIEKINTTTLLKRFMKTSRPIVYSHQSVIPEINMPFIVGNISFSDENNETIGNYTEQTESINRAPKRSSTSIPNISKQTIYQDKETVNYIFNKSSTHIVVNSSVSHMVQHQRYTTKFTTSYSRDKVNSKRIKLMQIISNLSNNPMIKNKSNAAKENSNGNISEKYIKIANAINDNVGDKRHENTDEIGNTAYRKKRFKRKEGSKEGYNTNKGYVKKHTNKQHNINENNTNDEGMNRESLKDNTGQENNATENESKTDNAVKDRRKKHNRKDISMEKDNRNVKKNTVKDIATLVNNNRSNKNTVKVLQNKYKLTEDNKKAYNIKKDNKKEDKTAEQNENNDNTDKDNTYDKNTKKNNTSEENAIENDSNNSDSLEYNTNEDGSNEYYTEEDSTEEDNFEDHVKEDNSLENNSKDDRPTKNTNEYITEEDNTQESMENRYIKNGKDNIFNDISRETFEDVENHQSSEENTIEGNVSQGDSDENIVESSAMEDLIYKANDELNKEKHYIRRLLEAANSTATNNNDDYMRPLNNRYNRKNESKYGKNKKQYREKKIAERNRQHKYQRKPKQDEGISHEKNQSRNQNKSNNRNRKWRTLTDEEENKEDNRNHKRKHAFILNIKKVIFEKSLKDINWEL